MRIGTGIFRRFKRRRGLEEEIMAKLKQAIREVLAANAGKRMDIAAVEAVLYAKGLRPRRDQILIALQTLVSENSHIEERSYYVWHN